MSMFGLCRSWVETSPLVSGLASCIIGYYVAIMFCLQANRIGKHVASLIKPGEAVP